MKLKYDTGDTINSPNENDIINSLSKLNDNIISFFILEKAQKEFLQCTNSDNGKLIEYHHNGKNKHLRFRANQIDEKSIIQIIISFLNNNKVDDRIVKWETFWIKERSTLLKNISRVFFWTGIILLFVFIWDYKINDNSSHLFEGIILLYFITAVFVFLAIGFISDFYRWNKLRIDEKSYVIASIVLAIFLIVLSIVSSLGYGNFAK